MVFNFTCDNNNSEEQENPKYQQVARSDHAAPGHYQELNVTQSKKDRI
jgi:hypothetical protein